MVAANTNFKENWLCQNEDFFKIHDRLEVSVAG